jgi:hypothetical protein
VAERVHSSRVAARFWRRVQKGPDCWRWTGGKKRRPDGSLSYGVAGLGRRQQTALAHRVAWEIVHGPIPDGKVVCHDCDNPLCVRPEHLFLGTRADNLRDMRQKGRGYVNSFPCGSAHPKARLTAEDVREIRTARADGVTLSALASRFGVHISTIGSIARRTTWRHV